MRPLEGIKVLDFSTLLPGPMAGLMLAEAGAHVIKVERPGGEEMRRSEPRWGRESASFAMLNRGKAGIALDLRDRSQLQLIAPLVAEADVLIEQFRPGVMDRLGLGYQAVSTQNPRLVYCSITGYGQTGPKAGVAGHDLNYIGDTGLLSLSMGDPERPTVPPVLAADLAAGSYAAFMNILLGLMARERTGQGTHLDISMTDGLFGLTGWWAMAHGLAGSRWPVSGRELLTGGSPRYQIYPTADGRHVAAAPLEQKFWDTFCGLIDLPEPFRNDRADPSVTIATVREIIASKPSDHWRALFYGQDCCCSIVQTWEEAMQEPHFRLRGLFDHVLRNEDGAQLPAAPVPIAPQFRGAPGEPLSAPSLGAHNDLLLK